MWSHPTILYFPETIELRFKSYETILSIIGEGTENNVDRSNCLRDINIYYYLVAAHQASLNLRVVELIEIV